MCPFPLAEQGPYRSSLKCDTGLDSAKKLGEHGHRMKFLGYPHNSSGYRTYDPVTHKVEVVWAPIFHEEARPHASIFFESEAVDSSDDLFPDPADIPQQERITPSSSEAPSPDPPASPTPPTHPSCI